MVMVIVINNGNSNNIIAVVKDNDTSDRISNY